MVCWFDEQKTVAQMCVKKKKKSLQAVGEDTQLRNNS